MPDPAARVSALHPSVPARPRWGRLLLPLLLLSACGGGDGGGSGGGSGGSVGAAGVATATVELLLAAEAAPAGTVTPQGVAPLLPAFHLAPLVLDAPDDADSRDNAASAARAPRTQALPAAAAGLDSRGLTLQALQAGQRVRALGTDRVVPAAAAGAVTTYTPAQIRAAHGLAALPPVGTAAASVATGQAAALGAGQTIYVVAARHAPNVAAELAAFNARFGLPGCTVRAIAAAATLPLPAADAAEGCVLSVVHTTLTGAMTATPPAYDAGWATEMALDVQWAHAIAPLARIVLIEASEPSLDALLGAIGVANALGPGVVSMSFGATEGGWTTAVDGVFQAAGMSYVAATGDAGTHVSWPAVSPQVLAVGGTSLRLDGRTRRETAWSQTGGGLSAHVAVPAYQAGGVPGVGALPRRGVADVAFNADPATGQYIALLPPGASTVTWMSAGGTSLATPQWAALLAIANAQRAATGQPPLGRPHARLYAQAAGAGEGAFADITSGSHGSCAACSAVAGYDQLTGLGTPNAGVLLAALVDAAASHGAPAAVDMPAAAAPALRSATLGAGVSGQALAGTLVFKHPTGQAMRVTIAGVPAGMAFTAAAQTVALAWPQPVAGQHRLDVTVRDDLGLATQASVAVTVAGP